MTLPMRDARAGISPGLVGFLLLAIAHGYLVWGYSGLFWGDAGRWLHEIDRFASGETLYRDFYWAYPPLAMWFFGTVARLFGSDVAVVWLSTQLVYLGICALYYRYVVQLMESGLRGLVLVAGLLLAVAYANRGGHPLPLGMYSPAAPLGFLFLIMATNAGLVLVRSPDRKTAALLGFVCALCLLTKQDFWVPAGYIMLAATIWLCRHGRHAPALALVASGLATVVAGIVVVSAQAGISVLPGIVGGFGTVAEFGGLGLPSWERLSVEVVATSFIISGVCALTCLVSSSIRRRAWFVGTASAFVGVLVTGVYATMTSRVGSSLATQGLPTLPTMTQSTLWPHVQAGSSLLLPSLELLRFELQIHVVPVLLPVCLLAAIAVRWRGLPAESRARVAILLGLCVAARVRRLFEGVDWFHFLLETPVYLLTLQLLVRRAAERTRLVAATVMLVAVGVGVHAYWDFGRGPLTRRGVWEAVWTPRGTIRMPPIPAGDYRWLQQLLDGLDPEGNRPLFAFGFTGGFNYYLDRHNPAPVSQGFRLSLWAPDTILVAITDHRPPPFFLDSHLWKNPIFGVPALELDPTRWSLRLVENHYERFDRPYFERLIDGCAIVGRRPDVGLAFFELRECSMN